MNGCTGDNYRRLGMIKDRKRRLEAQATWHKNFVNRFGSSPSTIKCRNSDGYRIKYNESRRRQHQALRYNILMHYGGKCACCAEKAVKFLTIDHVDGGGGKHRRSLKNGAGIYRWLRKNELPDGFRVLCWNCNSAIGLYGVCPHKE